MALALFVTIGGTLPATVATAQTSDKTSVQKRQTAMLNMQSTLRSLEYMLFGLVPFDQTSFTAAVERLGPLAQQVPALFAGGPAQESTNARPEIWSDALAFEDAVKSLQDSLPALKAAAQSGDRDVMKTTVAITGHTCNACHIKFVRGHWRAAPN